MNKFALVIIGIVATMAVLIALPSVINQQQQHPSDLEIQYDKQRVVRTENDMVVTWDSRLTVEDGGAFLTERDPSTGFTDEPRGIDLDREKYSRIKSLILDTGFMDIPSTDYLQVADGAGEYVRHALTVRAGDSQKTFNWVDPHEGTVPPIIKNIGAQLDEISGRP